MEQSGTSSLFHPFKAIGNSMSSADTRKVHPFSNKVFHRHAKDSTLLPLSTQVPTTRQHLVSRRWSSALFSVLASFCLLTLFALSHLDNITTFPTNSGTSKDAALESADSLLSACQDAISPISTSAPPVLLPHLSESQACAGRDSVGAPGHTCVTSLSSSQQSASLASKEADGQSITSLDSSSEDSTAYDSILSESSLDECKEPSAQLQSSKKRYELVPLPPRAKRIPRPLTLHNQTIIDHYRWMHEIEQDPDVTKYIRAETNYTNDWIENSHIKQLFDQIDQERQAIKKSIADQDYIRGKIPAGFSSPIVESQTTFLFQSQDGQGCQTLAPKGQRLEGTQFWDVDTWRYWRDDSKGDYGVYLRRRIPLSSMQLEHERALFGLERAAEEAAEATQERLTTTPDSKPHNKPIIQIVLDVNKLQRRRERQGMAGQFTFGMLEIQPRSTILEPKSNGTMTSFGLAPPETILAAYSYDVTGDERYSIRIMPLTEDPRRNQLNRVKAGGKDTKRSDSQLTIVRYDDEGDEIDDEEEEDKGRHDYEPWGHPEDPTVPGFHSIVLNNTGVGTRWARIGDSLYLYYTQQDHKGLQREVWRVCIQSRDPETGNVYYNKLQPELVMHEDDKRNYLAITQTNDRQYLLIESTGQTTSHTYFLDLNDPKANWILIREPENDAMYSVEHHTGYFYIRTNRAGSENFEVIRIPVSAYRGGSDSTDSISSRDKDIRLSYPSKFFGGDQPDEQVIVHNTDDFIERFEVFVDHFAAWIWREGLQEIRIFDAPKASFDGMSDVAEPKLPLKVRQCLRPWRKETRVATVLPGCIRGEDDRLYRNFFTTHLQFCNSSFIRPWALYEFDMNAPSKTHWHLDDEDNEIENDRIVNNATTLICQDPFPIGVVYGDPRPSSELTDMGQCDSTAAVTHTGPLNQPAANDDSHLDHQSVPASSSLVSNFKYMILAAEERIRKNAAKYWQRDYFPHYRSHHLCPSWHSKRHSHSLSLFGRRHSTNNVIERSTETITAGTLPQQPHQQPPQPLSYQRLTPPPCDPQSSKDRRKRQEREMARFTEKRLMVPSTHTPNVSIPVSLVYYDFEDRNFPRPAFVMAYGAYGTMTSGEYDPLVILPVLHRGLIFVQVHPRGDGVLGPHWYRDGKLANKTNTFYDVEDALLYLKKSGMVKHEGCAIEGRSAGGLISGWMANRWGETTTYIDDSSSSGGGRDGYEGKNIVREMVKVVLAQVPFLDVIAGMADKDIPWVEYEWTEWGNPADSIEIYEAMKKYSPYDGIRTQPYPPMMIVGGLSDSRVSYAEPLKYVAKLRSIDGKMNDCHGHKKPREVGGGGQDDISGLVNDSDDGGDDGGDGGPKKRPRRPLNDKMCDGRGETPLLLQMEDGGHFSGNAALWMAFALGQLDATKVVTPQPSFVS